MTHAFAMSRILILVLFALGIADGASAQSYRCSSGASVYYSDKPCGEAPGTRLGSYGPLPTPTARYAQPYVAPLQRAPEHLKFLGAECATLNDAIRTAPGRGVRGQSLSDLRDDYQRRCSYDEQQAMLRLREEESELHKRRQSEREQAERANAQTRAQIQQCAAMRDTIGIKRGREASLNAAEVTALRALESAYNERCLRY